MCVNLCVSKRMFFPRASEQRVLLIVEVCHHIFSSSHLLTSSHIFSHLFTSSHIFSHLLASFHIFSHLLTSSYLLTSSRLHIFSHLLIFTYSHIFSSSHITKGSTKLPEFSACCASYPHKRLRTYPPTVTYLHNLPTQKMHTHPFPPPRPRSQLCTPPQLASCFHDLLPFHLLDKK